MSQPTHFLNKDQKFMTPAYTLSKQGSEISDPNLQAFKQGSEISDPI